MGSQISRVRSYCLLALFVAYLQLQHDAFLALHGVSQSYLLSHLSGQGVGRVYRGAAGGKHLQLEILHLLLQVVQLI